MLSIQKKTLTHNALKKAVTASVRGKFADGSVRKEIERMLEEVEHLDVDLCLHEGDLRIEGDLCMGNRPFLGLLIVQGDLEVTGLLSTSRDPDTVLVVTGNLRAQRLISSGLLEVHGNVTVEQDALWLDNDGCAEIFGDLRAKFTYTMYHAVKVHGRVEADLILGDDDRFESSHPHAFVCQDDEEHKDMLRARLPAELLEIVGDPEDGEDEWCIDNVDTTAMSKMVQEGKPVLRS